MAPKKNAPTTLSKGFVIGRDRFEKISAVEGVKITPNMKKREAEFDKRGMTAKQRRKSIVDAHRKG